MRTRVSSLVSAKWLADKIQTGAKVHVTHSIYQPKSDSTGSFMSTQYLQAHIPNSSYTNLYELADSDSAIPLTIPTAEQFADYASERGIRNDDHVVIYDNTPPLAFHYSVCRTWLLFKLFGHTHVSILHGGLAAWIEAGQSVTDKIPEFIKSEYEATLNEKLSRSYEDIVRNSKSQNAEFQLIDARGSSGFNAGSVPGSKNIPFSNFYNDDGSFKDFEQIEDQS
ncbi:thiosulfate sulfurtransferase-like [Convolutriloba macropyga]|uniref:thiosulfate sulfurtransferase-like n=1 Tax=Convolutriloba macropyga TaxID=536237 RepID=UPI003F527042